jgi:hypothetical protein
MTYLAKLKLRSNTSGPIHAESLFMQTDADGDGVAFLTTETFLTDGGLREGAGAKHGAQKFSQKL